MSWEKTREQVLDRDEYECRFCGMTDDEHNDEYDRGLHAHHILKDREGGRDHPDNLLTVCEGCHDTLEHTHAKAIAEVKRENEPDETAETKLKRLSSVWQSKMELTDEINSRLSEYVDRNPITARELGAYTESGPDVCVYDLRSNGEVYEGQINSEFRFAAIWGYKQALQDLLFELENEDSQLRHRETPQSKIKNIYDIISAIATQSPTGAHIEEVLSHAEDLGMERSEAEHEIEKLRRQGDVYEPNTDHLRTV